MARLTTCDDLAAGTLPREAGDFRRKIEALINFLGHDDASNVAPENSADWCGNRFPKKGYQGTSFVARHQHRP